MSAIELYRIEMFHKEGDYLCCETVAMRVNIPLDYPRGEQLIKSKIASRHERTRLKDVFVDVSKPWQEGLNKRSLCAAQDCPLIKCSFNIMYSPTPRPDSGSTTIRGPCQFLRRSGLHAITFWVMSALDAAQG